MAPLFGNQIRTDMTIARPDESPYEFYDRVDDAYFAELRSVLNRWFKHYPADGKEALRSRIVVEEHHNSALWELYLHERLFQAGFTVEVEEQVRSGGRPDFRVTRDRRLVGYVEATVDRGTTELRRQGRAREHFVYTLEKRIRGRSHVLYCNFEAVGLATPSLSKFTADLEIMMKASIGERVATRFLNDGWSVTVDLEPLDSPSPQLLVASSWFG